MSEQDGTDSFHMVQCWLDPRRLVQLGKMHKLPLAKTDTNYLVHCALGRLFGDDAPKPFFVDDDPRTAEDTARERPSGHSLRVLGYSDCGKDDLRREAKLAANPTIANLCDWDRFDSHEMPQTFRDEKRLGFELRACPVVRKSSAGEGENRAGKKRTWRAGQELDVFLSEAWTSETEEKLDREKVYGEWLKDQFEQRGGAKLKTSEVRTTDDVIETDDVSMTRFSIERVVRRHGQTRKPKNFQIPDVTLTGTLEVDDSDAFIDLLRSGIGRHKSFGYGMLKVRRA
jgi:CRISPR system Cascade subunit CasE